jgi:hypothetical protein
LLKGDASAPQKQAKVKSTAVEGKSKGGLNPLAVVAILLAIVAGIYFSMNKK